MTTKNWIFYIISSVLSILMLTLTVLMCIPSTQKLIADRIATKLSPAYAEIKDDNAKKDSQINDLTNEINNLNKTILEKDASIEEKNKLIAEKDSLISSQTEQLNICNANIQTLSTQKASLLTAVTEIDNKINSTTDSIELDDLEARKNAILSQIDTLNTQISTLQTQKTQLEQDIATLQQEKTTLQAEVNQLKHDKAELQNQVNTLNKTFENYKNKYKNYDFDVAVINNYVKFNGICLNSKNVDAGSITCYSILVDNIPKFLTEVYSPLKIGDITVPTIGQFSLVNVINNGYSYGGVRSIQTSKLSKYYSYIKISNDHYKFVGDVDENITNINYSTVKYFLNGKEIQINSLSSNVSYPFVVNIQDTTINICFFAPEGKYVSTSGNIIDFDNNYININGTLNNLVKSTLHIDDDEVVIWLDKENSGTVSAIEQIDGTLLFNGETFTKVTTEDPTTPTTSVTWKLNDTIDYTLVA